MVKLLLSRFSYKCSIISATICLIFSPLYGKSGGVVSSNLGYLIIIAVLIVVVLFLILKLRKSNREYDVERGSRLSLESKYNSIFTNTPTPIIEMDLNGNLISLNSMFTKSTGYTIDDIDTLNFWRDNIYDSEKEWEEAREWWCKKLKNYSRNSKETITVDYRIRCKDGKKRFYQVSANILDSSIIISFTDIDQLKQSREYFYKLFELAPFSCTINDMNGDYVLANEHFCKNLNLKKEDVIGKNNDEIIQNTGSSEAFRKEIKEKGVIEPVEIRYEYNGRCYYSFFSSRLIEWDGEEMILSATVDITKMKLVEAEIIKQEKDLKLILNSINDAVIAVDSERVITEANNKAKSYLVDSSKVIYGEKFDHLFPLYEPDSDNSIVDLFSESFTQIGLKKDRIVLFHSKSRGDLKLSVRSSPILDDDGSNIGNLFVIRDVTEELQLRDQLSQSQKLNAIGNLAGGLAHDFNNMLGAILGYAELSLIKSRENVDISDYLEQIIVAGKKSAALTNQLLAFARKQSVKPKIVDINKSIESMFKMLDRVIGEQIKLRWVPAEEVENIKIDPSQVDQIVANLVVNSRDAIDGNGTITIETSSVIFSKDYISNDLDFTPGSYVGIIVSDTGSGISKQNQSKIFEPFFTTKEQGKGTGLGLATIFGIVKQNGGFINLYSEEGVGTTIKIYLPSYNVDESRDEEQNTIFEDLNGSETVLLVEDEEILLNMSQKILEDLGYNVIATSSPNDALKVVEDGNERVDILITDVMMPEINGKELKDRVEKLNSSIKYLYMSGYTENIIADHGVISESTNLIHKPFSHNEFGKAVREVLNSN